MPPLARAERGSRDTLLLRILSALVLMPVALAAAWFGSPWLPIVTVSAAGLMAWEWTRLCCGGRPGDRNLSVITTVLFAVIAGSLYGIVAGGAAALGAAVTVAGLGWARAIRAAPWLAAGILWIALPCVLFLWLAQPERGGRMTLLWIFAVVWATDIGAYASGRLLRGPLLAPRWSPRKTWAGLAGGVGCAAFAGWATAGLLGLSSVLPLVLVSAGLALVEQFGDLAESAAKRRFGVKDASGLIPGHGGLLDRLDGLLAVVPAVALLTLLGGGSVLAWR